MGDYYYYDSEQLDALIANLKLKLRGLGDSYQYVIQTEMKNLRSQIDNDSGWVQDNLKPVYLAKFDEYLKYYSDTIQKLNAHITYLEKKANYMSYIENIFSGG